MGDPAIDYMVYIDDDAIGAPQMRLGYGVDVEGEFPNYTLTKPGRMFSYKDIVTGEERFSPQRLMLQAGSVGRTITGDVIMLSEGVRDLVDKPRGEPTPLHVIPADLWVD